MCRKSHTIVSGRSSMLHTTSPLLPRMLTAPYCFMSTSIEAADIHSMMLSSCAAYGIIRTMVRDSNDLYSNASTFLDSNGKVAQHSMLPLNGQSSLCTAHAFALGHGGHDVVYVVLSFLQPTACVLRRSRHLILSTNLQHRRCRTATGTCSR